MSISFPKSTSKLQEFVCSQRNSLSEINILFNPILFFREETGESKRGKQ